MFIVILTFKILFVCLFPYYMLYLKLFIHISMYMYGEGIAEVTS